MRNGHVAELEVLFRRPAQPGCPDKPGPGQQLPFGHVAVAEGQLAGGQVAADEQAVPRGRGGDPGPGIPALALGAGAGGADLPPPPVFEQAFYRLGAGEPGPAGQRDREAGGDPQHVGLAASLQEVPQLGAAAVHLVPADEIEAGAVGVRIRADTDGQLPLGTELQASRQPGGQRPDRIGDVLARDPLPGADQRVPGLLPHIRQVDRVDAVRDAARAPQVLALDAGRGTALLFLARLVQRPDPHPALPAVPPRGPVQPGHGEPAYRAHRRQRVPAGVIQQPLRLVRRPVPGMPGDAPPVALRQVAHQRGHVLARLQPYLRPREARPQQPGQFASFLHRQRGAYPDGSSRLRFCCQHKHMDRQAAAPYARLRQANAPPQVRTPSAAAVLGIPVSISADSCTFQKVGESSSEFLWLIVRKPEHQVELIT